VSLEDKEVNLNINSYMVMGLIGIGAISTLLILKTARKAVNQA
jgi:hypothetical protein